MFNTFFKNIGGVIVSPGKTLGAVMGTKKWLPVFLLILLSVALYTNVTLPFKMASMSENPLISEYFPGEQLLDLQENVTVMRRIFVTGAMFFNITLSFIIGAFMVYLFFGIAGADGYFINFFTLIVYASIIDTLLPLVRDALSLLFHVNLGVFTNLVILFPSLEPLSLNFFFVSQVDLFAIWYVAVIAAGVSVYAKMSLKKCLFVSSFYFIFKSVVAALFSYLGIKIMSSLMT